MARPKKVETKKKAIVDKSKRKYTKRAKKEEKITVKKMTPAEEALAMGVAALTDMNQGLECKSNASKELIDTQRELINEHIKIFNSPKLLLRELYKIDRFERVTLFKADTPVKSFDDLWKIADSKNLVGFVKKGSTRFHRHRYVIFEAESGRFYGSTRQYKIVEGTDSIKHLRYAREINNMTYRDNLFRSNDTKN